MEDAADSLVFLLVSIFEQAILVGFYFRNDEIENRSDELKKKKKKSVQRGHDGSGVDDDGEEEDNDDDDDDDDDDEVLGRLKVKSKA
ncbi:hypothetical protein L195_g034781, partial [Trifolium pratense]